MIGYSKNHARYTYKLYNPETRRVLLTRYAKWVDWKMTDPTETLKMFCKANKEELVSGIEEHIVPTS